MLRPAPLAVVTALLMQQSLPVAQRGVATDRAVVRGRVTAADSGKPLQGARVVLAPLSPVFTAQDGRYEIREVPPGRYTLKANKEGYVEAAFGEARPRQGGKIVAIEGSQRIEADFSLLRPGAIEGRVGDAFGEPIVAAIVEVFPVRYSGGRPTLGPPSLSVSNDAGEYRAFGLQPGLYWVAARKHPGIPLTGNVAVADIGFDQMFAPGTSNLQEAQRVRVQAASTTGNIDLTLPTTRFAGIRGRAFGPDGRPLAGARVDLMRTPLFVPPFSGVSPTDKNGLFTINGVPPGTYQVRAKSETGAAIGSVAVEGQSVSDLVLAGIQSPRVVGRLLVDPETSSQLPLSSVSIRADPPESEDYLQSPRLPRFWRPSQVAVDDNLSFSLTALPGRWRLLADLPTGWVVKGVRQGTEDVTDTGISFEGGETITDVEIEVTDRLPRITGAVLDKNSNPVSEYTVLLFAGELNRRLRERFFALARPDQAGHFSVNTLAPGDYFAVALTYVDTFDPQNPALLEQSARNATRFSLSWGQSVRLTLRLAPDKQ